jgi:hypothetical protein
LCDWRYERTGHGKFSVVFVVGGECRRGSCRDASGGE